MKSAQSSPSQAKRSPNHTACRTDHSNTNLKYCSCNRHEAKTSFIDIKINFYQQHFKNTIMQFSQKRDENLYKEDFLSSIFTPLNFKKINHLLFLSFVILMMFGCDSEIPLNKKPENPIQNASVKKIKTSLKVGEEPLEIILDMSIKENKEHSLAPKFSGMIKNCKSCIKTTYYRNKECGKENANKTKDEVLIYTLKYKSSTKYDTLINCANVHYKPSPKSWRKRTVEYPTTGSFPSGVYYILDDSWGKYRFTLGLTERAVDLDIVILNEAGETVKTIIDERVEKGEHRFVWNYRKLKKGLYRFAVTIDGQEWTQQVNVN